MSNCGCNNSPGLYGYDSESSIGMLEDINTDTAINAGIFVLSTGVGFVAAGQVEKFLTTNKDGTKKTDGFLATAEDENKRDWLYILSGTAVAGLGLVSTGRVGMGMVGLGSGWGFYGAKRMIQKKFPTYVYESVTVAATAGYDDMRTKEEYTAALSGTKRPSMSELLSQVEKQMPTGGRNSEKEMTREATMYNFHEEIYM